MTSLVRLTSRSFIPCKTNTVWENVEFLSDLLSSGGSHLAGTKMPTTGLCGLGKAVRDLGLDTEGPLNIDFLV